MKTENYIDKQKRIAEEINKNLNISLQSVKEMNAVLVMININLRETFLKK